MFIPIGKWYDFFRYLSNYFFTVAVGSFSTIFTDGALPIIINGMQQRMSPHVMSGSSAKSPSSHAKWLQNCPFWPQIPSSQETVSLYLKRFMISNAALRRDSANKSDAADLVLKPVEGRKVADRWLAFVALSALSTASLATWITSIAGVNCARCTLVRVLVDVLPARNTQGKHGANWYAMLA